MSDMRGPHKEGTSTSSGSSSTWLIAFGLAAVVLLIGLGATGHLGLG